MWRNWNDVLIIQPIFHPIVENVLQFCMRNVLRVNVSKLIQFRYLTWLYKMTRWVSNQKARSYKLLRIAKLCESRLVNVSFIISKFLISTYFCFSIKGNSKYTYLCIRVIFLRRIILADGKSFTFDTNNALEAPKRGYIRRNICCSSCSTLHRLARYNRNSHAFQRGNNDIN